MIDLPTILLILVSLSIGTCLGFVVCSILVVGAIADPLEQIDTTYDDLHRHIHSVLSLPEPKGKA